MTFWRKHFPGDYRDDLYVSRISGARRMTPSNVQVKPIIDWTY